MSAIRQLITPLSSPFIIVTGAAGYLGSHFLRAVCEQDCRIIAIDRHPISCHSSSNVITIIGDLDAQTTIASIEDALDAFLSESMYWFHFAALFPKSFDSRDTFVWRDFETNNVQITRNLIALAKKYRQTRLFFFPSTAHLDRAGDAVGLQLDFYGRSKNINEKDLLTCHELRAVVWRLPRVIGILADSCQLSHANIADIDQLHHTLIWLLRTGELPEDIVSILLLRATEDSLNPTLSITNAMIKRSYVHISELTESLVNIASSNAQDNHTPVLSPFLIEEMTLYQIGLLVVEELRSNGLPISFVHDGDAQACSERDSLAHINLLNSVVKRTVKEYFLLAVQHMLLFIP